MRTVARGRWFCLVRPWLSHLLVMIEPVKLSEWARAKGGSRQSATRWFHAGVLPVPARQLATGTILVDEATAPPAGVVICARVSSADQRDDLDRQLAGLTAVATKRRPPPTKVVAEVGSGLNGQVSKLLSLLGDPGVGVIVVEHRGRLAPARLYGRRSARRRAEATRAQAVA